MSLFHFYISCLNQPGIRETRTRLAWVLTVEDVTQFMDFRGFESALESKGMISSTFCTP